MYQRPMRPIRQKQTGNWFFDLIVIGVGIYGVYINTQNLRANRANAYATQQVAKGLEEVNRELDILNRSDLVCNLHNKLNNKEN